MNSTLTYVVSYQTVDKSLPFELYVNYVVSLVWKFRAASIIRSICVGFRFVVV